MIHPPKITSDVQVKKNDLGCSKLTSECCACASALAGPRTEFRMGQQDVHLLKTCKCLTEHIRKKNKPNLGYLM